MIHLHELALAYGEQVLFADLSGTLSAHDRVGLIGRNGAGKSTLLKIIAGLTKPNEGTVSIERDKKIAYMPQEVVLVSQKTAFDEALTVFDYFIKLEQEKIEIERLLASGSDEAEQILERYTEVIQELEQFDRARALARTERIMRGLGFNDVRMHEIVTNLSVGWRMRLVLAQLLLQEADFYLFDEPTNHLDIVTKEWFFDFLKASNFGFLLVSHDKYYLDHACDSMLELERGVGTWYKGHNFSEYIALKEHQRQVKLSTREREEKEMARKQATIERFRASASKAKMAQSMIKQLDKMELTDVEPPLPTINLQFPASTRAGEVVLTVKNLSYSFGSEPLFQNLSCHIMRGEKVALVAANGMGKTTLFNLISGAYKLQQGTVTFGHNVTYAVFEQDQMRALKPTNTVMQEVLDACPNISQATIRTFLGSFLFSGDSVYKSISALSGGERNRVAMVKVLLQKANLLLLDEPTNHLDIYAKDILLQALRAYDGTIIMVSHDHDFLQHSATRILELTPTGLLNFPGDYESYRAHKKAEEQTDSVATDAKKAVKEESTGKLSEQAKQKRKESAQLEQKITKAERDIKLLTQSFETLTYGSLEYRQATNKLAKTQQALQELTQQWEKLTHS